MNHKHLFHIHNTVYRNAVHFLASQWQTWFHYQCVQRRHHYQAEAWHWDFGIYLQRLLKPSELLACSQQLQQLHTTALYLQPCHNFTRLCSWATSMTTGAVLGRQNYRGCTWRKKHFPSITYHQRWPLLSRV